MTTCISNEQELRFLLAENTPLSTADTLTMYQLVRDQLLLSMTAGEAITYLEIRNRRVQVTDPRLLLETVEEQIDRYTNLVASQDRNLSTRNRVSFRRC